MKKKCKREGGHQEYFAKTTSESNILTDSNTKKKKRKKEKSPCSDWKAVLKKSIWHFHCKITY